MVDPGRRRIYLLASILGAVLLVALGWKLAEHQLGDPAGASNSKSAVKGETAAEKNPPEFSGFEPEGRAKAAVSGTITDERGAAIAGAQVCAFADADRLRGLGPRLPRCARSEADGHFRVEGLWPVRTRLSASAAGFVPAAWATREAEGRWRTHLRLRPGQTREGADIELRSGGVAVRGVIKDIAGGEIEGALVSIEVGRFDARAVASSGADGRFDLWAAPGTVRVQARREGYAPGWVRAVAPGEFVELFLTPESVLVGRVVHAETGAPIPNARVNPGSPDVWNQNALAVRSDAEGRFRIDGLAPGIYKPAVSDDELFGLAREQVHLGLGEVSEPVIITAHPARLVEGRVVIADSGDPPRACPGGRVSLQGGRLQRLDEPIDAEGRVRFRGVLPGRHRVNIRCEGQLAPDPPPTLELGADNLLGLSWEVREGRAIRGEVVDELGETVAGVTIRAKPVLEGEAARGAASSDWVTSEADGSFAIIGLRPGSYELHVGEFSSTRPGPAEPLAVELEPGADRSGVRIELPATGSLRGRIVDAEGQPVAGARIDAQAIDGAGEGSSRSDDAGEFILEHLRPGSYRVHAFEGGTSFSGAPLRAPGTSDDELQGERVEIRVGECAELQLVVEARGGVIRGRVVDGDGGPVADAFVGADRMLDRAGASAASARAKVRWSWDSQPVLTDLDGRFELGDLPEGRFIVRAHRKGGGEALAEDVELGAELELAIAEPGELAGSVTVPGGEPPDSFEIRARDAEAGVWIGDRFFRSEGAWRLREVPPGRYTITVTSEGGVAQREGVELGAGEIVEDIEIELLPLVTVRGRVVDLDSREPIVGVAVGVASKAGGTGSRGDDPERGYISDEDGRFECLGAPTGPVSVLARVQHGGSDSPYRASYRFLELPPTPAVQDIGELELIARRLEPSEQAGDPGFRVKEWDPSADPSEVAQEVSFVRPDGPADAAGLQVGDRIETLDGHAVGGEHHGRWTQLLAAPAGQRLTLGLADGGTVELTLGPPR